MSEEKNENNSDYFINYALNGSKKKISVYLPFNDNYLPIAKAIVNACSLFSSNVIKLSKEKEETVESDGDVLVVCSEEERIKMIKHPDCYWIETKELSIEKLVDPSKATEFSEIAKDVYKQLMVALSHKYKRQ
jgi:hypothetical protein